MTITESDRIEVDAQTQTAVLAKLKDVPPMTAMFAGTADQKACIWNIKQRHLLIREKLSAYFSGKTDLNTDGLSQFGKDDLELEKDRILAFYALVQGSWGELMQLSESEGVFWQDYGIQQPGDMIAKFIEASAHDMVARVTAGYFRWSPSASRKRIKECRQAIKLVESTPYESLRAPEKRKVDKVLLEHRKNESLSTSALPLRCILTGCETLAKKAGKHSAIKYRLAAYKGLEARSLALASSQLDPRKKHRGWEMVKGQKQMMGTSGGVASA